MGKPRSKRLRTHFTELSSCHPQGSTTSYLPYEESSPRGFPLYPGFESCDQLSRATGEQTRNEFWPCCPLTSDVPAAWSNHSQGRLFHSLSSSCALPQTPKAENLNLSSKPKKSNTLDSDHIDCLYYWLAPGLLLHLLRTQIFLFPILISIWISKGWSTVLPYSSIFKI